VQGATVTFTAPASGPSGTFAGGVLTATAATNASGIATAPAFTANGTGGSYNVAATAGALLPVNFSLTNTSTAPPTADSVTPNTGAGTSQNFTFRYSSVNGYKYLNVVHALINGGLSGAGGCWTYYLAASNALYLINDAGNAVMGPLTPGATGSLSNSQCTINGAGSSAVGTGNTLALTLPVVFNPSFIGTQKLFGYAADNASLNSGWQTLGTWTLGTVLATPPTTDSVTPNTGAGTSQNFTFKYSSVNGYKYLNIMHALINGGLSGAGGCWVYYVAASNALYLINDAGSAVTGPLTPGGAGSLSNSQCTINGAGSSAVGTGNTLALTLAVVFNPSFIGTQKLFGYAADNASLNSGWQTLGTWTSH
jgi:hypothetical protein